jgi:hypothetical protein
LLQLPAHARPGAARQGRVSLPQWSLDDERIPRHGRQRLPSAAVVLLQSTRQQPRLPLGPTPPQAQRRRTGLALHRQQHPPQAGLETMEKQRVGYSRRDRGLCNGRSGCVSLSREATTNAGRLTRLSTVGVYHQWRFLFPFLRSYGTRHIRENSSCLGHCRPGGRRAFTGGKPNILRQCTSIM